MWIQAISRFPNQAGAYAGLGDAYQANKQYKEAIDAYHKALGLSPKKLQIDYQLAEAEFDAGETAQAVSDARSSAGDHSDALLLNDAAYILADHNQDLQDAQQFAEEAVHKIEQQSAAVTLEKAQTADFERMTTLGEYWDTLGWVLYRQHRLPEAESYLSAAWNLTQIAAVGAHLGRVYEEEGKVQVAIHIYALALAAGGETGDARDRIYALLRPSSRVSSAINAARDQLSDERMVHLGKLPFKEGSAEFFLLLAPTSAGAKLEDIRFVKGSDQLKSATQTIEAKTMPVQFPTPDAGKLLRRAVLMCTAIPHQCDLVLYTPDVIRSGL